MKKVFRCKKHKTFYASHIWEFQAYEEPYCKISRWNASTFSLSIGYIIFSEMNCIWKETLDLERKGRFIVMVLLTIFGVIVCFKFCQSTNSIFKNAICRYIHIYINIFLTDREISEKETEIIYNYGSGLYIVSVPIICIPRLYIIIYFNTVGLTPIDVLLLFMQ